MYERKLLPSTRLESDSLPSRLFLRGWSIQPVDGIGSADKNTDICDRIYHAAVEIFEVDEATAVADELAEQKRLPGRLLLSNSILDIGLPGRLLLSAQHFALHAAPLHRWALLSATLFRAARVRCRLYVPARRDELPRAVFLRLLLRLVRHDGGHSLPGRIRLRSRIRTFALRRRLRLLEGRRRGVRVPRGGELVSLRPHLPQAGRAGV